MTSFARVSSRRKTAHASLATRAPFHLEATVRVLQRRPSNLIDVWEQHRYLRVLSTASGLVLVQVENQGTIDNPAVRFRVLHGADSPATRAAVTRDLRMILGLDVDPAPLQRLLKSESGLGDIASALRGMRPPRYVGLFETFANVIPFQQVSLDSGVAVVRRLVERFGQTLIHEGRAHYAFPTARAIVEARLSALRACGLSRRKAEALRGVASVLDASELTEDWLLELPSDDAMRLLTELRGIGDWSAGVVLLRGLRRLDVFPQGDVGVARGLSGLMHLKSTRALDRVIRRFGDKRGYLYFCSLGGVLLDKRLIHAAPARRTRSRRYAGPDR